MARGRPTKYNRDIADKILYELSEGRILADICEEIAIPRQTVHMWMAKNPSFHDEYIRARERQAHSLVDDALRQSRDRTRDIQEKEITYVKKNGETTTVKEQRSDNTAVNRDKLICDQIWRLVQCTAAQTYGARQNIEHTGKDGGPIQYETIADRPAKETFEQWQLRVTKEQADKGKQVH